MPKSFAAPNRLVMAVAYDGLCIFEYGVTAEIFGLTRPELDADWYRFVTIAADEGPMRAQGGLRIAADAGLEALADAGTIVIPGWRGIDTPVPPPLVNALGDAHARGARLISICSGAFVLAETGLLNGRRATTHWRYADALARRYPRIAVDPAVLYIDEAPLFTSAGSAAGIDLLLHIVRQDFGPRIANAVARRLVMAPHRQGGQAQFIDRPMPPDRAGRLAPLLDRMRGDLAQSYRIADLARAAAMSERTFLRRFAETTGTTPGEWLIAQRVEAAKQLLEDAAISIETAATAAGFGTVDTLRHHFRRRVGVSPGQYRRKFAA